jgi:hypothetical protein
MKGQGPPDRPCRRLKAGLRFQIRGDFRRRNVLTVVGTGPFAQPERP